MRIFTLSLLLISMAITESSGQVAPPQPFGPLPTANQLRWQAMEYYAFVHFSTNTYTDQEWGYGEDDPGIFNPTKLDCRQWARVCKQAGMKGIIITAKHHSGFCLWPSSYTEYSIKNSPWKNGKGDIVGELAEACKEYGLKLGIYLSPWDRNSAVYGKPEYITYFRNQLRELLTNYGDIFEVWFDGANGGSGYYGGAKETRTIDRTTYYDWRNTYKLIRELQPNIVIWNDNGDRADLRWVGTEGGSVGETNWSLLNAAGEVPYQMLHYGLENGDSWVPGEVNTSIRPGWFYHPYEDSQVKALPKLMETYYQSVGRNGTFLLNFPINKQGLIHETDAKNSLELAAAVKAAFAHNLASKAIATASNVRGNHKHYDAGKAIDTSNDTYWATDDGVNAASITLKFTKPTAFNNFMAQEYIALGQRVKAFKLEALLNGSWQEIASQTTIGYKRILHFPTVTATQVRFSITDAKSNPVISNIGVFLAPQILTAPGISRNKNGAVSITADDKESVIFYTLDGTTPTSKSLRYTSPIPTEGKVGIKAIAYETRTKKSDPAASAQFDISHKTWTVRGINDPAVNAVIDGNTSTSWFQPGDNKLPADLVIDLGKTETLTGFKYLPAQGRAEGIVNRYQFHVSEDNQLWKLVDEGEFANIQNNPLWQHKQFSSVKARYVRLRALSNTQNNNVTGYAEIEITTQ